MAKSGKTLNERMGEMEIRMDEIIIPKLNKVVDYVEENKGGINTASILNNKIVTIVIGGIIAVGIYFLGKGGAGL